MLIIISSLIRFLFSFEIKLKGLDKLDFVISTLIGIIIHVVIEKQNLMLQNNFKLLI